MHLPPALDRRAPAIPAGAASPAGPPGNALLLIADPDQLTAADPTHLGAWFNLTPKEAQLTALISHGHTLEEAANLLDISRGTARTHLKHTFMKTGVNTQVQLVALTRTIAFSHRAAPLATPNADN